MKPEPPAGVTRSAERARAISEARLGTARIAVVIALLTACIAALASVGADSRWLAALGRIIFHDGSIPAGIPFATAPTGHWVNTLVLAELIFYALHSAFGDSGLQVLQLVAVATALYILARDARQAGARDLGIVGALAWVTIGSLPSFAVARVQLFSLILFPVMLSLLRAEARAPSRRIWLVLPLLALWSNLHGGALAGLALLYAYLAFSRARTDRATAIAVGLAALPSLCLTPAGIDTIDYYRGLLTNLAAERGVGQWAPLGGSVLDVLLIVAVIAMALRLRQKSVRPQLWELVALLGFAILTVKASRDGVWLLFLLAAPAAIGSRAKREWNGLLPVAAVAAIALIAVAIPRWSTVDARGGAMVRRAVALAHGGPILADGIAAERVALGGGRILVGNPLDAFSRPLQGRYLDWLAGSSSRQPLLNDASFRVVLVGAGSDAQKLTSANGAFVELASGGGLDLYARRNPSST